jgi:hypothetical protein
MACRAESRRDSIATGALKLGEMVSGEGAWRVHIEQQRAAGIPDDELRLVPDDVARASVSFAQGLVALVKSVVEEALDVPEAVRAARRGAADRAQCLPGDELLQCMGNGCGVVPHRRGPSPDAGPAWRCSECGEPRSGAREPEGVKVGDTFRRCGGRDDGKVFETTNVEERFGSRAAYLAGYGWQGVDVLTGSTKWEPVRAVEVAPLAEPGDTRLATDAELAVPAAPSPYGAPSSLTEAIATWGGMEPMDSGVDELDGPAGEERAGVPSDAAQALADMTAQRDAWEASCTSAAKELREAGEEIARLAKAWKALDSGYFTPARLDLNDAICALSARAVSW